MDLLIGTAVLVLPLIAWLVVGSRLDARRAVASRQDGTHVPWHKRHLRLLVAVVVGINLIPVAIWSAYGFDWAGDTPDTPWPDWMTLPLFLGISMWQITVVGGLGWLITRAARRSLRSRPTRGAEPILLEGRRLRLARGFWLTVFIAGVATSLAYLAGLWTEANRVRTVTDNGIGIEYFYGMDDIEYSWSETSRYMGIYHEVVPKEDALKCRDCHGRKSRLDWEALGYEGDPSKD